MGFITENLVSKVNQLIIFFLVIFGSVTGQENAYSFKYLSVIDGLPDNGVTSIIQDAHGFMWFGTRGGLTRYDGYEFKNIGFEQGLKGRKERLSPLIERLYQDKNGNIWIGTTSDGLCVYQVNQEKFIQKPQLLDTLPNRIIAFLEDDHGIMWIGGWTKGMWRYNENKNKLDNFLVNNRINSIIQTNDSAIWWGGTNGVQYYAEGSGYKNIWFGSVKNEVTEIVEDPNGKYFWVVGWHLDLKCIDRSNLSYTTYKIPVNNQTKEGRTYSLMVDNEGYVWVGTWGNGVYRFDPKTKTFDKIEIEPEFPYLGGSDFNIILDLYQDSSGNIWIGTDGGGVVKVTKKKEFHTQLIHDVNDTIKNHINTILLDSNQNLWVGTKGNGLFLSKDWNNFTKVEPKSNAPEESIIKLVVEDSMGNIWVSFGAGLYVVKEDDKGEKSLISAYDFFQSPDLKKVNKVTDILLHKNGQLWFATQQKGIYLFEKEDSVYHLIKNFRESDKSNSIRDNRISKLLLDKNDDLWVGTYKGLYKYQPSDSSFISLDNMLPTEKLPTCETIVSKYYDQNKNMWFGTPCGLFVLSEYNRGNYDLKEYRKSDGIIDEFINGILEDNEGNIWISTNLGISKINPKTNNVLNFEPADGIGDYNYSISASAKSKDGTLFFGGITKLTSFNPANITINEDEPNIVFTDFRILNKEVLINNGGILSNSINNTEEIVLTYRERELSFKFAILDYTASEFNQYAYWLEGFNDSSIYTGDRRYVSFSNLKPGQYILHIKGANSNGIWSKKGRSLKIKVLPAPWKTWYAVVIYLLVISLVIYLVIYVKTRQNILENSINLEIIKREKAKELNDYKLKFFTNISHELRTPLTLILVPEPPGGAT